MGAACAALDSNWIGTGVRVPREQRPRVSVVWAQSLMSIDCIRSFFPDLLSGVPELLPSPQARTCQGSATVCSGARSPHGSPSMLAPLMHQGWGPAVLPWVAFYGLVYGTAWVLGPLLLPHCGMVKMLCLRWPSSAPVPPQSLAALGSLPLPGRGRPTGRPATASGARASRLQSRRSYRL